MNIKKVGLTALAGSLVATSAIAGELSLSGGAKLSYVIKVELLKRLMSLQVDTQWTKKSVLVAQLN